MPIHDEVYLEEEDRDQFLTHHLVTTLPQQQDLEDLAHQSEPIDPHIQEASHIFVSNFTTLRYHKFDYKQVNIDGSIVDRNSIQRQQQRSSLLSPHLPYQQQQQQQQQYQIGSPYSHVLSIPNIGAAGEEAGNVEAFDDIDSMISPRSPRFINNAGNNNTGSLSSTTSPASSSFFHRLVVKKRANSASATPENYQLSSTGSSFNLTSTSLDAMSGSIGSARGGAFKGSLSNKHHLKPHRARGKSLAGIFRKDPSTTPNSITSGLMDDDDSTELDIDDDDMVDSVDYMTKFLKNKEHVEKLGSLPPYDEMATNAVPSRRLLSIYHPEYRWIDVAGRLCNRRRRYRFDIPRPFRFALEPRGIKFERQFSEPLLGRVAIYDTASQRKISEDFHFFASDSDTLKMLPETLSREISNAKNKCLFSVSEPTSSMYFVLFVDRILTYGLDDAIKSHSKELNRKEEMKIVSGFLKHYERLGHFRQPFLWGFAPIFQGKSLLTDMRTIQPLYSVKGSHGNLLNVCEIIESGFYATNRMRKQYATLQASFSYEITLGSSNRGSILIRDVDDFAEFSMSPHVHSRLYHARSSIQYARRDSDAGDLLSPDTNTNLSIGSFNASVSNDLLAQSLIDNDPWSDIEPHTEMKWSVASESEAYGYFRKNSTDSNSFSESDVFGRPSFSQMSIDDEKLAEECHLVCEFPYSIVRTPHLKYVNQLFVTPLMVNFQPIPKVRNVMVEVMFRNEDSDIVSLLGEQRIGSRFDSSVRHHVACTAVQYHEKSPQFFDEIRIDLPPVPRPKDHLFFTFYNVRVDEVDTPKQKRLPPKRNEYNTEELSVLGYAFLPLYQGDNIAQDGVHQLTIVKELKPFYLQPQMEGLLQTTVKTKFEVSTRLISTVYPKDIHVKEFFDVSREVLQETPNTEKLDEKLKMIADAILGLKKADNIKLLPHVPVILNMLFNLLSFCPHFTQNRTLLGHVSSAIFQAILSLTHGVSVANREYVRGDGVLSTYIQYFFDDAIGGVPVFSILPKLFDDMIKSNEEDRKSIVFSQSNVSKLLGSDPVEINKKSPGTLTRKSTASRLNSKAGGTLKKRGKLSTSPTTAAATTSQDQAPEGEDDKTIGHIAPLQFSWFLFDIIIKSLTLHSENKIIEKNDPVTMQRRPQGVEHEDGWLFAQEQEENLAAFRSNFHSLLNSITRQILKFTNSNNTKNNNTARLANRHLALFMRDLIPILQRSHFIELLATYMEGTKSNDIKTLRLKIEFFQILIDQRDFVAINHPRKTFGNRAARFFLDVILEAITRPEDQVDEKAIKLLSQHLTKIDFDARFQEDRSKELVAEIYLPFIDHLLSVADFNTLAILQREEMLHEISICVLWILRNLNRQKLVEWWNEQRTDLIIRAFNFFERVTIMFSMSEMESQDMTQVMLNLLHVVGILVEETKPLIEDIKSGNVDMLRLPFDMQQSLLSTSSASSVSQGTAASNDEHQNALVFSIMEAFCQFFHSLVLCCRSYEPQLCYMVFEDVLRRFLELFINDIVVEMKRKTSRTELKKYERKWQLLVGAVFACVEHPSSDHTHPSIMRCLRLLTDPLYKPEEHNTTVKPDPENLILTEDDLIKAASLDNLIERLVVGARDKERYFNKVFLLTYYSFTKPPELIRELIGYYHSHEEDSIRLKLLNFLGDWIKKSFHDFTNYTIAAVMHFLDDHHLIRNHKTTQQKVKRYLLKELFDIKVQNVNVLEPPPPLEVPQSFNVREMAQPRIPLDQLASSKFKKRMLGSNPFDYPFDVLEWPSVEIARQMTLIESDLFKRIEPKECFGLAWSKKDKRDLAPNIVAISERFNKVNQWVQRTILTEPDLRKRQALLVKFVDIVKELRKLNNFVSINQICSAINSASIHRMKKTMEALNRSDMNLFVGYSSLFHNPPYRELRRELQMAMPNPAVPFIGMYLTELTFIEDGNRDNASHPTKEGVELINFTKRRLYSETILNIQLYQQTPYNFTRLPYLQYILTDEIFQDLLTDKQLYTLSLKYEGRQKR